jgi:hypothetical protein
MKWLSNTFSLTLIFFVSYCFYKWYSLVYRTKLDFVKEGTKSIEALFYEEIFSKIGISLLVALIIILILKVIQYKKTTQ